MDRSACDVRLEWPWEREPEWPWTGAVPCRGVVFTVKWNARSLLLASGEAIVATVDK